MKTCQIGKLGRFLRNKAGISIHCLWQSWGPSFQVRGHCCLPACCSPHLLVVSPPTLQSAHPAKYCWGGVCRGWTAAILPAAVLPLEGREIGICTNQTMDRGLVHGVWAHRPPPFSGLWEQIWFMGAVHGTHILVPKAVMGNWENSEGT